MIRTGILGMGIRGEMYAEGLIQNPDAELVSICDIAQGVLNDAVNRWDIPGFQDFGDLLDTTKPDAVIVCTPDYAHCEPALMAASQGVSMLIEKPLATTEAQASRIVQAVRDNQIICQVAFENRWNPSFVQVKNAVEAGALGDISLVNAKLNDTLWVPTEMISWADKTTVGWFLLPHILDLAIWLSGKQPVKVYSVANKKVLSALGIDTFDSICTTVSFEGDMQAVFENSWVLPESSPAIYDFRFSILGDKGAMHVNTQEQMIHQFTDRFTYPGSLFLDIHGQKRGFPMYMLDSFVNCLKYEKEPIATVEEGYTVTRVVEAVHRSVQERKPIEIDW